VFTRDQGFELNGIRQLGAYADMLIYWPKEYTWKRKPKTIQP